MDVRNTINAVGALVALRVKGKKELAVRDRIGEEVEPPDSHLRNTSF